MMGIRWQSILSEQKVDIITLNYSIKEINTKRMLSKTVKINPHKIDNETHYDYTDVHTTSENKIISMQ